VVQPPVAVHARPVAPARLGALPPSAPRAATGAAGKGAVTSPALAAPRHGVGRLKITAPGSWVAVYLDGLKIGEGAGVFAVRAGRHRLRVENPPLGYSRTQTIDVVPGVELSLEFLTRP
jgi:hypothetical protein